MLSLLLLTASVTLPFVSAATLQVQVGPGGQFIFQPEYVSAAPGDEVVFNFNPKNHTVTQSSFANPCTFNGGINTGFMPVAEGTTPLPTAVFRVNDTSPVWFYCAQGAGTANSHCGAGMVFAINSGPDGSPNSFATFKQAAIASGGGGASGSGSTGGGAYTTAAYGGVTIPAEPTPSPVTQPVTLSTETWTTTYSSWPNSPGPTPASAQGNVIKVVVGGADGRLVYDPPRVSAAPRDTIQFEFRQKNHTVTQSSFDDPCRASRVEGAFDSGFMPVAADATTFPTWNFTVTSTAPIYAYCRQTGHCGQGMVFAINTDESSPRNFQAFQDLAKRLNGTGAASGTASGTGAGTGAGTGTDTGTGAVASPTSDAASVRIGVASIALVATIVLATLW